MAEIQEEDLASDLNIIYQINLSFMSRMLLNYC